MKFQLLIMLFMLFAAARSLAQDAHGHAHGHDHAQGHAHGDAHKEHTDEVKLTPEAIRRNGIRIEQAKKQTLSPTFTAPARVSFNTEAMAHVGSVLSGRIVEAKVKVGDTVKRGDELLVIESSELAEAQSDFLLKRTEAEVAAISVEPAKQAYSRAESLHQSEQGMALAEVQKRQAEWKGAQGKLTSAQALARAAENKLHALGMSQDAVNKLAASGEVSARSAIFAPIGGQVIEREVTLGELVGPDRDALLVLADLSTLWVIADIPEARIGQVSVGAAAKIQLAAIPNAKVEGKVTHISASVNADTRTGSVRIEVTDAGPMRPGMFARAEITSASQNTEPVLAVSEDAVLSVEGEPCVFVPVEGEENTFARRPVKVGSAVGGMLPIIEGLTEGQSFVAAGAFILKADLGKSGAAHQH